MARVVRLSDAAALGLHAAVALAQWRETPQCTRDIAKSLKVSAAHLSKVLQQMQHTGLVSGERGPHGGYTLAREPASVTLKEVYEAIEGPLTDSTCLLRSRVCGGKKCILGDLMQRVNREFREYLARTTLADLVTGGKAAPRKRLRAADGHG